MVEEKEPETWDQFFATARKKLTDYISGRRADEIANIEQSIPQLDVKVQIGKQAENFIASSFWNQVLLPMFEEEAGRAMKPWMPGDKPFNPLETEANYYYQSGNAAAFGRFLSRLQRMVEEGREAQRRIEFKRQQISGRTEIR